MLQLELFTDEITVSHVVWDNGREVFMHYRRDDNATSRFLRWQYRPDWRAEWNYVQAPRIILNLDNGVHPRTGEYVTVPGIIERMTQGEYERAWELMKDTVWECQNYDHWRNDD